MSQRFRSLDANPVVLPSLYHSPCIRRNCSRRRSPKSFASGQTPTRSTSTSMRMGSSRARMSRTALSRAMPYSMAGRKACPGRENRPRSEAGKHAEREAVILSRASTAGAARPLSFAGQKFRSEPYCLSASSYDPGVSCLRTFSASRRISARRCSVSDQDDKGAA